MRLSELVANLTPAVFAEMALILFFAVFVVVAYGAFRRGARTRNEQWAQLPLCDDSIATTTATESNSSVRRAS